jgi:hypothetical protein
MFKLKNFSQVPEIPMVDWPHYGVPLFYVLHVFHKFPTSIWSIDLTVEFHFSMFYMFFSQVPNIPMVD